MNAAMRQIRRALLSVSDKSGLVPFAAALAARGVVLLSTGGTARALAAAGLPVTEVAAVTGFPELLDGRVKTLHPAIHAGLLAQRERAEHRAALAAHGIAPIDLLVCNLYPFAATLAAGAGREACLENIDIGGPALIRAAAKNHQDVAVVIDPADYQKILAELAAHDGALTLATRRALAARPRYGENPHQEAAFYRAGEARPGVASARQLQGKELSYNNYADADAAFELVAEFARPAVAIVKHANPCGVALGAAPCVAWEKALACDPVSAFGGVVALNRPLDAATAAAIARIFVEVVIAPAVDEEAAAVLAAKPGLRLLVTGGLPDPAAPGQSLRSLAGGLLVQQRDARLCRREELRTVTRRAPSEAEIADLLFAEAVAKHVKSNAIVFARDGATVGIGAGQMSRVDSVVIAAQKAAQAGRAAGLAAPPTAGSVVASDAFFPFADGVEAAIAAGATAILQPGGSRRDAEIIAAADKAGVAMVFTGTRHFRH